MRYEKPALDFAEQTALLIKRGLVTDATTLEERLRSVSYFRLSGYLYPFRDDTSERYVEGTTLTSVWRRYTFDRQLRLLTLDAIERFEIDLRARLVTALASLQGPTGYVDRSGLPNLGRDRHASLLGRVLAELQRSHDDHARHFKQKYSSETFPPYWLMSELSSFGTLRDLFTGAPDGVRREIADRYDIEPIVLDSWIRSISIARNICAHHGRFWNKHLGYSPAVPRASTKRASSHLWHEPVGTNDERIFPLMTVLKYLVDHVAPNSAWFARFDALAASYSDISPAELGFPPNWRDHGVWRASCA